jgi:hypothetical protein
MIYEAILTTLNDDGSCHITPLGYRSEGEHIVLMPFIPSRTEANLRRGGQAVVNLTDNISIFAGCLTDRRDWPLRASQSIECPTLEDTLASLELVVESIRDDDVRPAFVCRVSHAHSYAPFRGYNRAQSAVLELAILVSRLHMLQPEKIDTEIEYLRIAIEKTAGEKERQGWDWLMEKVNNFREQQKEKQIL